MRLREQLALLIELQKMESAAGRIAGAEEGSSGPDGRAGDGIRCLCAVVETEREQLESLRKSRREKDSQLQAGQETLKTNPR